MANKKTARRALFSSVLALILCCCMLVGTTFAWFTDSVTSAGNKIQSGTLKVDLELLNKETNQFESIKESQKAIFDYDLWEPGYTQVEILKIENEGNLALKWFAKFTSQKELSILANVIDVYVCPSATVLSMPGRDLTGYTRVGTVAEFVNTIETTTTGSLYPAGNADGKPSEAYLGIALKMQESAGNEYQNLDLGGAFDIMILATQEMYEADSFNEKYDENAEFDAVYTASAIFEEGVSSVNALVYDGDGYKVAAVQIPAAAIAENENEVKVKVVPSDAAANIVVAADKEAKGFDVSVLGLKENNTELVTVELRIPAGLDPATVELYHYDQLIACSYNPNTGYVTFQTADFSPFTVVYDAESEYEAPATDNAKLPVAIVTDYTDIKDIEWGKYGQWSPTEGLEANLESAYTFSCKETAAEAALNPYANWYCDFYVSLDRNLGENQIFLGGNYGSFGWVGFHNGDLTLDANTEIGLLEGVTTNPWTYLDVANYVGTFICGVGDVNNALSGATFTVKLRLTNPENSNEYYDIQTINYTFNYSLTPAVPTLPGGWGGNRRAQPDSVLFDYRKRENIGIKGGTHQ